ncbi:hypothetical protein SGGMMB4_04534 [Sodalis glossinidius str. 'morsitans']|uniref:Uncharacterized protein n=1 Tax=Sodalis glossinidius (strain morsitans) TaxID=343509 RepID=A0A193QLW6_SODGM|nr:hypothetical protein SGGMMB4_04534 [Sodalis glossinidius str. 'morsitans']
MVRDARVSWVEAGLDAQMPVAVQQYIHVTDSHQAALAWLYSKPAVVAPVVGVTALRHLGKMRSAPWN